MPNLLFYKGLNFEGLKKKEQCENVCLGKLYIVCSEL